MTLPFCLFLLSFLNLIFLLKTKPFGFHRRFSFSNHFCLFAHITVTPTVIYVGHSGLPPGEKGFKSCRRFTVKEYFEVAECITVDETQLTFLEELESKCRRCKIVIMSSPPGTGKTSSLQMLSKCNIPDMNFVHVKMNQEESGITALAQFGLDLSGATCKVDARYGNKITVFLLDDAQWRYGEAMLWDKLLKQESFTPDHIRILVSATHYLGGDLSPIEVDSISDDAKLPSDHFLLSEEDSKGFLKDYMNFRFGWSDELVQIIVNDCGGNIGALRIACEDLHESFRFCRNENLTFEKLLNHYLSTKMLGRMSRCFGSAPLNGVAQEMMGTIRELLFSQPKQYHFLPNQFANLSYHDHKLSFMSPLAKRYFMSHFYPLRSSVEPTNLLELVKSVIQNMSSNTLQQSVVDKSNIPKEAMFQHLFMSGVTTSTPCNIGIHPELSRVIGDTARNNGEMDFFINGTLCWGVELLIQDSRDVGERISRFEADTGKYAPLRMKDYIIVDVRQNATGRITNVTKHQKKLSVFFKAGDFRQCQCQYGSDDTISQFSLNLSY